MLIIDDNEKRGEKDIAKDHDTFDSQVVIYLLAEEYIESVASIKLKEFTGRQKLYSIPGLDYNLQYYTFCKVNVQHAIGIVRVDDITMCPCN